MASKRTKSGNNKSSIGTRRSPRFGSDAINTSSASHVSDPGTVGRDLMEQFDNLAIGPKSRSLELKRNTGICFEEKSNEHFNLFDADFAENPNRFKAILEHLESTDLLEKMTKLKVFPAEVEQLQLCHSDEIIEKMKLVPAMSESELELLTGCYDSVYFNKSSYECALLSVGATIELIDSICTDKIRNGISLLRPPGHHAMHDEPNGYCIFNNIAIATKVALQKHSLKRILIVDWDVHHGQGVQDQFYDDPRVLYFSIHRYQQGYFWPHLERSNFNFVGDHAGKGFNVNVPLNKIGCTDADYLAIFYHILLPLAYEFDPELVIVAAGFDAAQNDYKGEMNVTPNCYGVMTHLLKQFAQESLALIWEGGYNLEMMPLCVAECVKVLLGHLPSFDESAVGKVDDSFEVCFDEPKTLQADRTVSNASESKIKTMEPAEMVWRTTKSLHLAPKSEKPFIIYDYDCCKHCNPNDSSHPERPSRITRIIDKLQPLLPFCDVKANCSKLSMDLEVLKTVHDAEYIDKLVTVLSNAPNQVAQISQGSVFANEHSLLAARLAAGGCVDAVDRVLTGENRSAVAVVRPPGHHAEPGSAMGFCFLNNVAIAAAHAVAKYKCSRIAIIDWDVHHGNGTQHMFYDRKDVFYISVHRYDNSMFYPGSVEANFNYCGKGPGEGYNLNIPWSSGGPKVGDVEYISVFLHILLPVLSSYQPELILVSCGFDAATDDPLGGYNISPSGYAHMLALLRLFADGKIVVALEGGYNLNSISNSMFACVEVLLDRVLPRLEITSAMLPKCAASLLDVFNVFQKYVPALKIAQYLPKSQLPVSLPVSKGVEQYLAGLLESVPLSRMKIQSLDQVMGDVNKTALFTDMRTLGHVNLFDSTSIERPKRLSEVWKVIEKYELDKECIAFQTATKCSESDLKLCHDQSYIDSVAKCSSMNFEELEAFSSKFDDVYFCQQSFELASIAASCAIEATKAVLNGQCRNAMVLVRPPGHHASRDEANGFCVFNNVALAARKAIDLGQKQRVLIVDWDVHHGHGTQRLFYDDNHVLYFSIHRYEQGAFWPNLRESNFDHVGVESGAGFNVNVPVNESGLGDVDYMAIFHRVLLPLVAEFQPTLVLVSAGFDPAIGCPEGHMNLSPAAFAQMVHSLMNAAEGKVVVVLEGGYCVETLAESNSMVLRTLMGEPPPPIADPSHPVTQSVLETITNVIVTLKDYWTCFGNQNALLLRLAHQNDKRMEITRPTFLGSAVTQMGPPFPTRNQYGDAIWPDYRERFDSLMRDYMAYRCVDKRNLKTGLAYDQRVKSFFDELSITSVECPQRVTSVMHHLESNGILDSCFVLEGRLATREELELVHSPTLIDRVKAFKVGYLGDGKEKWPTYTSEEVYNAASIAVGTCLTALDSLLNDRVKNAFVVVRPPGHHATSEAEHGFCFFNNLAITARKAQTGYSVKKILILDLDVHFGDGTSSVFDDDPNVLYISLHRFDYGSFYPAVPEAGPDNVGSVGGMNVNIAWNDIGKTDSDYLLAFHQIVLPICQQFNPEMILVSAGFDGAKGDPLGECCLSPQLYGYIMHSMTSFGNGRVMAILEGGYSLINLQQCVAVCVQSLQGSPPVLPIIQPVSKDTLEAVSATIGFHLQYWNALSMFKCSGPNFVAKDSEQVTLMLGGVDIEKFVAEAGLEDLAGFQVEPIANCPHVAEIQPLPDYGIDLSSPCKVCLGCNIADTGENWICLTCYEINCSRFVQKHGPEHFDISKHSLALSFTDLSIWCYQCDSYVYNDQLKFYRNAAHLKKFGVPAEF